MKLSFTPAHTKIMSPFHRSFAPQPMALRAAPKTEDQAQLPAKRRAQMQAQAASQSHSPPVAETSLPPSPPGINQARDPLERANEETTQNQGRYQDHNQQPPHAPQSQTSQLPATALPSHGSGSQAPPAHSAQHPTDQPSATSPDPSRLTSAPAPPPAAASALDTAPTGLTTNAWHNARTLLKNARAFIANPATTPKQRAAAQKTIDRVHDQLAAAMQSAAHENSNNASHRPSSLSNLPESVAKDASDSFSSAAPRHRLRTTPFKQDIPTGPATGLGPPLPETTTAGKRATWDGPGSPPQAHAVTSLTVEGDKFNLLPRGEVLPMQIPRQSRDGKPVDLIANLKEAEKRAPPSQFPRGTLATDAMNLFEFHGTGEHTDWWYNQIRNGGAWDYKQTDKVRLPHGKDRNTKKFTSFGNFNFGATGAAIGFSLETLHRGAGWAQKRAGTSDPRWKDSHGDDPRDREWITKGYEFYQFAKKHGLL